MSYDKPYVELPDGHRMPIVGLGTWTSTPEEVKIAVKAALEAGYRHIDTAYIYQNEKAIGEVLKEFFDSGKLQRKDLFIVTKLPPNGMRATHVKHFLQKSLERLQLSYVDLYLVHTCIGFQHVSDDMGFSTGPDGKPLIDYTTDHVAIWNEMEKMVEQGLTKSIGVSNWSVGQLQRILDKCKVKPANIQVELHAYFQQDKLVDFCHKNGITVCAWGPMGSPGLPSYMNKMRGLKIEYPHLMSDPLVEKLAKKYNKTPANILLRFWMQREIVVIPKSVNPERIKANFQLFDFKLEPEDYAALRKLDRNSRMYKMDGVEGAEKHPEYEGYL